MARNKRKCDKTKKERRLTNNSPEEESESSHTTGEIETEFCVLTGDDLDQVVWLNREVTLYEDSFQISLCFIDHLQGIKSGDFLLGIVGYVDYNLISKHLNEKFKQSLKKMMERDSGPYKYFVSERILNTPLDIVLRKYLQLSLDEDEKIIFVSRLYKLGDKDLDEVDRIYGEYAKEDLKYFPVRNEEIFLIKQSDKEMTVAVRGVWYRVVILSSSEMKGFIRKFENEIL
jgi:hypothetical protein